MTEGGLEQPEATATSEKSSRTNLAAVRRVLAPMRLYAGGLGALVFVVVYLSITQPFFLTSANLYNVFNANASLMLISIGMTFVIIKTGFDLSVGSMAAVGGFVVFFGMEAGLPEVVAVLLAIVLGALFGGIFNGGLIGKLGMNFFVVTLGSMSLLSGAVLVISNGTTESISTSGFFGFLGNGDILGVPAPIWICAVVAVVSWLVLRHTLFGRAVFAAGGNPVAARLAGINVSAITIAVYAIAGACAALAGVIDASRLGAASPNASTALALTAAAAVLLGGTSFLGGIGGITGTVIGVALIAVLQNGLGLAGVSTFWQGIVTGSVLIAAVGLDRLQFRGVSS